MLDGNRVSGYYPKFIYPHKASLLAFRTLE